VCGLAETPYSYLSNVGETFHTVIKDQYLKIRDSDPAWYEADGYLTDQELEEVHATGLADLILRNTNLQPIEVPCFVMSLTDGCGLPVSPPTTSYDFLVTLVQTTAQNPLYGNENPYSFAIDGNDGFNVTLVRGRNYTFFAQVNCNHALFIATSPDITIPPFAPPYDNVVNQFACLHQNPLVTVIVDDTTPDNLYYQCALHNYMGGVITVVNPTSTSTPSTTGKTTTMKSTTGQMTTTAASTSSPAGKSSTQVINNNNGTVIALGIIVAILALLVLVGGFVIVFRIRKPRIFVKENPHTKMTELDARN